MYEGSSGGKKNDLSFDRSFGVVAAAHELKSPVALIRQMALSLEMADISDEKSYREYLHRIVLTSEKSLRLTESLTHAESLNTNLFITEPVNVQQICEDVAHELTPLYKAYGRDIIVKKRRALPLAVANRDLLRRILLNFGDNALHYADGSGAEFKAVSIGGKVRVGLRDFGPVLTGLNIASQHQQQRVYRPESSGLGLIIAERFAGVMNGKLGTVRHRNGMTYYVDILQSEQLCLL